MREVVIIGSGPAGYTAALYTARAQLKPLRVRQRDLRRRLADHHDRGRELPRLPRGRRRPRPDGRTCGPRPRRFGAEMIDDDIVAVDLTGDIKLLTDSEGTVHRAKTVIVATGSGYRKLGLPREDELSGRGVSWCATCDGFFFRDRDIVVVGGGDTAMEEATFLTRFARSVTVVHRRASLRASKVMQDRAFADDKISFAFDSEIAEIHGDRRHARRRHPARHLHRRDPRPGRHRAVHRDRPRPAHRTVHRTARPRRRGLHQGRRPLDPHQPPRRLRRRRHFASVPEARQPARRRNRFDWPSSSAEGPIEEAPHEGGRGRFQTGDGLWPLHFIAVRTPTTLAHGVHADTSTYGTASPVPAIRHPSLLTLTNRFAVKEAETTGFAVKQLD